MSHRKSIDVLKLAPHKHVRTPFVSEGDAAGMIAVSDDEHAFRSGFLGLTHPLLPEALCERREHARRGMLRSS